MAAPHALMQLSLSAEDRAPPRSQRALQRRMDAMVDRLPSPVASASSKDFASAKRRGFSAPGLRRSVTAVSRLAPSLPAIPVLSRSSSSEAPVAAAAAGAPTLQRAKTDSGMGVPSLEPGVTSIPVTAMFASLKRPAARRSDGGADKLCPLDSPVGAPLPGRSFGSEEQSTEEETKARRFGTGAPSLARKSSKDPENQREEKKQEQKQEEQEQKEEEQGQKQQTQAIPSIAPPVVHEAETTSQSPKTPATKGTPKKSLRKFFVPSLRRSSTGSSEKSMSSSVAPAKAADGGSDDNSNNATPAIAEHPEAEAADAASNNEHSEPEAAPTKLRMFGIPSLLRTLTDTKRDRLDSSSSVNNQRESMDAMPSPTHSSSSSASNQTQPPSPVGASSSKPRRSMLPPVPPGTKAAARFFSGMKPMLLRNISTSKTVDKPAPGSPTKEKTPSTAEEDSSDTNAADEDEEMNSLLFMLQVPRGRRGSQLPLMATGQEEIAM